MNLRIFSNFRYFTNKIIMKMVPVTSDPRIVQRVIEIINQAKHIIPRHRRSASSLLTQCTRIIHESCNFFSIADVS